MLFQSTAAAALALATVTYGASLPRVTRRSDGPANSLIYCGCDDQSDASVSDCQAAINSIDVTKNDATDPTQALSTHNSGALGSISIMNESGGCQVGAGSFQTINGPGGVGGGDTGTTVSGQDLHDIMQAILDGCQDASSGKVNGCASVGAGDVHLGAL